MVKSQAVLTEAQVIEVLELLGRNVSHKAIAELYHVSKKTISRINTGETWSDVSNRNSAKEPPTHNVSIPNDIQVSSADDLLDLLDMVTSVKNHFGLSFETPLDWGHFDWYDGQHSVATDGIIMWESTDLVAFASRLVKSAVTGSPIFCRDAKELPTLSIKEIMTQPIGGRYTVDVDAGGVVRLVADDGSTVLLRKKYVDIAARMRFELRQAGTSKELVYLTRAKTKTTADTSSVVMACVAVVNPEE